MLHYLLNWNTYSTLKSGLLTDFIFNRIFHNISVYFFYTFTIFFGDKFILEHFFSNFSVFFNLLSTNINQISKNSFINFFSVTLLIVSYFLTVAFILYIL